MATLLTVVLVDADLHRDATERLAALGMTVDDAVSQMFSNVVEGCGVPFSSHTPNAETKAAMQELDAGKGIRSASLEELFADMRK